ncbi:hypothetical protein GTW51_21690 [Aurantimonas aggregata]|uniref:PRC-barrel domain-containing protein n=1 Tax=Aurantimonas aggregata TaxID=2047720 RepID=A0A6L9MPA7_9HYPH|nr:hypothetical protein [Aurantimonas aggregata]NDV89278.1 hypothetical protein [Aurantimonas aggregata]
MTKIFPATAVFTALFAAGIAHAQDSGARDVGSMTPGDVASSANSAAQALTSAARDKLLVKDLLGASVKVPGGDTVGTVENLVVVPGGRVVAAIIATQSSETGRIPIPFASVKLSQASGKISMMLPASVSELTGTKEVQKLRDLVPGM